MPLYARPWGNQTWDTRHVPSHRPLAERWRIWKIVWCNLAASNAVNLDDSGKFVLKFVFKVRCRILSMMTQLIFCWYDSTTMYHWILLKVFCRLCRMGMKVARNIYAPTDLAALRMYLSGGMFYESLRGLIVNELHVPSLHSLDAKEGLCVLCL